MAARAPLDAALTLRHEGAKPRGSAARHTVGGQDHWRAGRGSSSMRRAAAAGVLTTSATIRVANQGRAASSASAEDEVTVSFPETPLVVPYPEGKASGVLLSQHGTAADVAVALAEYIAQASADAIAARGVFVLALSGGSLVDSLVSLTKEPYVSKIDWSKWHVLWVDERFVRHTSDDSNFKQAAAKLLSRVPIPEEHILPTDDDITDLAEMAEDYDALLKELVEDGILSTTEGRPFPRLDLILLGLGPDGHTASLFPNHPAVYNTTRWVLPIPESPKPPAERISMTLPVINAARQVAFVAVGPGKAEVVQRVLERPALPGSLPSQLVRPYKGTLTWFLDGPAALKLSIGDWNNLKKFPYVQG